MSEAIARSDVAQIDGLTFSYDPVYISRLTHVAATDGDRTLPGHLAMAKLHATRNDLQAARTCIMGAFSIYGDPDGAAWEAYVLAAIVCRQMDVAEWLLSHRFGGYPAFSLVLGGEIQVLGRSMRSDMRLLPVIPAGLRSIEVYTRVSTPNF